MPSDVFNRALRHQVRVQLRAHPRDHDGTVQGHSLQEQHRVESRRLTTRAGQVSGAESHSTVSWSAAPRPGRINDRLDIVIEQNGNQRVLDRLGTTTAS